MSDASEVKRWQAWVIADEVQRFQPIPEFFVSDEDHDRIVADLKAEIVRLKEVIQHDVDKVEAAYSETIARQAKVIEKYQQAVTRIWVSSDNCEHDMEPNTTMDFFRCEKCGIPSAFAAIEQGEGM